MNEIVVVGGKNFVRAEDDPGLIPYCPTRKEMKALKKFNGEMDKEFGIPLEEWLEFQKKETNKVGRKRVIFGN